MSESTLNRVLFRSGHPWIEANKVPPEQPRPLIHRGMPGPDAGQDAFRERAGSYFCQELEQAWELVFADGGLWVVPSDEAAQLLTPNGPEGMRSRGVNIWFTGDAFMLAAVDEVTAASIDNLWFERLPPSQRSNGEGSAQ